jgi:hypothetical protein
MSVTTSKRMCKHQPQSASNCSFTTNKKAIWAGLGCAIGLADEQPVQMDSNALWFCHGHPILTAVCGSMQAASNLLHE